MTTGVRSAASGGGEALACARCGYDLRATAREGVCPECGAPVAEAVRLAALPRRPAWGEADPAWRRRRT